MILQAEQLNKLSLFDFPGLFATLEPPRRETLCGIFRGSFVGPGWVRQLARPLLVVTGLGGWWGKDFDLQGNAINLVWRRGQMQRRFPMLLAEGLSYIDRKPGLALHYAPENSFPWPWIVDELRSIHPGLILWMTMLQHGPLKRLALPFVLQPQENNDGI